MSKMEDKPCKNTDVELWREKEGDYYSDSVHVTKDGRIGFNCGGIIHVLTPREWLMLKASVDVLRKQAKRYEWLKDKLEFDVASYKTGPEAEFGALSEAYETTWFVRTIGDFVEPGNDEPKDLDYAIDKAMEEENVN